MNFTEIPLHIVGYNGSILPRDPKQPYTGLIRRTNHTSDEVSNTLHYFEISDTNKVLTIKPLEDTINRPRHRSWASGIEDARILTDHSCLAVTLDTNPHWKAEVSYVEFDITQGILTKILPLSIESIPRTIEKNWLYIQHFDTNHIDCLYSSNPIHVVRINLTTGIGQTIYKSTTYFDGKVFHNGSIVKLPDGGFLLAVREKDTYKYKHSLFLKLSDDYALECISDPFKFNENYKYEMCMSMHIETTTLVACVGSDDARTSIFTIPLSTIYTCMKV
jgi:hypothetical protein